MRIPDPRLTGLTILADIAKLLAILTFISAALAGAVVALLLFGFFAVEEWARETRKSLDPQSTASGEVES